MSHETGRPSGPVQWNGRGRTPPGWLRLRQSLERRFYRGEWPARLGAALGMPLAPRVIQHVIRGPNGLSTGRTLRIAYASDFHAGPTTHPDLLEAACAAMHESRPDVLLLGGDFVSLEARHIETLAGMLSKVSAPLGKYAVLGNHDWWTSPDVIVRQLTLAGVEVLINRNIRLEPPFETVWICGIDDPWGGSPDAESALAGADGTRLVLMHSPSNLLDIGPRRFELALCGHTHGGQIALPGGIPVMVPHGPLCRTYMRGRFDLDSGGVLIVSVGLGCSMLPFRVFAPAEFLLCDFTVPDAATRSP